MATFLVAPGVSFLTWKIFIIFQVVVVERFHSITPSLPVRHLEPRGGGGGGLPYEKARDARWKKLNLTPKGD